MTRRATTCIALLAAILLPTTNLLAQTPPAETPPVPAEPVPAEPVPAEPVDTTATEPVAAAAAPAPASDFTPGLNRLVLPEIDADTLAMGSQFDIIAGTFNFMRTTSITPTRPSASWPVVSTSCRWAPIASCRCAVRSLSTPPRPTSTR